MIGDDSDEEEGYRSDGGGGDLRFRAVAGSHSQSQSQRRFACLRF